MQKPYLIGVTGGSGSGKTSFIRMIREGFSEADVCILSQDDYYLPREEQKLDKNGIPNFDRPKSIDSKALYKDLKILMSGGNVERLEYTFNNDLHKPSTLLFSSAPIIIVEGLFIFHYKKIRKKLDMKVFIKAGEHQKVIRRIKRDRLERNYPLDDVLYRYENHVLPAFTKYIKPYLAETDIIINNQDNFHTGLEVFNGFLRDKLRMMTYNQTLED